MPVAPFLDDLVAAFASATASSVPACDVVHTWAAAREHPGLVVVGGIDTESASAFDIGGVSGAVTTDRNRVGYGGEQTESVSVTCSLTVPPADDEDPSSVAGQAEATLAVLALALRTLSTDRLLIAYVSSTSWSMPDQPAGFGALVIFTVAAEFHL